MTESQTKTLRIECEAHGRLVEEAVGCTHDCEHWVDRVGDAHRASFGAGCDALMTVYLDEQEDRTMRIFR